MRALHTEFRNDVLLAADWYDLEEPGVGAGFVDDVDAALRRIEDRPTSFPIFVKRRRIRRAMLDRFPYAIYFVPTRGIEYVLGIAHLARSPRAVHRQLSARDRTK